MKRIHIVTSFFEPYWGGAEKQVMTLARQLVKKDFSITVLTHRFSRDLPVTEDVKGIHVRRLYSAEDSVLSTAVFAMSLIIYLFRDRSNYDNIYVNLASSPAVVACIVGYLLRKKVVVKFGGGGYFGDIQTSQRKSGAGYIKLALLRLFKPLCVAVSRQIQAELVSAGFHPSHIIVIPNGIDLTFFKPVENKKALRKTLNLPEKVLFIFSGRLSRVKNLDMLLHAWKKAFSQCPEIHLVIMGDGPEKQALLDLVHQLDVKTSVSLVGYVPHPVEYYQASDIFVLISVSEGMPNSLLEARACGLFSIVADVGAMRDIVADGEDGIVISSCTADTVADALVRGNEMITQKKYRACAEETLKQFDIETIAGQYERIFLGN